MQSKECLPLSEEEFIKGSDAADVVTLHLGQVIQMVMDKALSLCLRLHLGAPPTYREAFEKLAEAGYVENEFALRLSEAADLRTFMVHSYEKMDRKRLYELALKGTGDFKTFLEAAAHPSHLSYLHRLK